MKDQTLVSTQWLAEHLRDDDLRVFDSTVFLHPNPDGPQPYTIESGRTKFDAGHIPGAGFLDLLRDLSRSDVRFPFTVPPSEALAAALASCGVTDDTQTVIYSSGNVMWATRVWWMLRALGIDRVTVLDGGLQKWRAEGRPTSAEPCDYAAGALTAQPRPQLWASLEEVEAAIGDGSVCTINALSPATYDGTIQPYGRPGHIPGSVNANWEDLLDPEDGTFLGDEVLEARYRENGALEASRAINYCGGGIAATMSALALTRLGHENVAVYDGSMTEWASDPERPLTTGADPF